MAYTPTTWANGDTITAAGLNKMEQGIAEASNTIKLTLDTDTYTVNKTWQEIYNAIAAGNLLFFPYEDEDIYTVVILGAWVDDMYYVSGATTDGNTINLVHLIADTANDYPLAEWLA